MMLVILFNDKYKMLFLFLFFQLSLLQLSMDMTMDMPQDIMGLSCIMDDLAIKGKVTKQIK